MFLDKGELIKLVRPEEKLTFTICMCSRISSFGRAGGGFATGFLGNKITMARCYQN